MHFNSLPDNKISDWSKLKAFAEDILNIFFHRTENIVGKEENAGYQHFLVFPQWFQKAFSPVHQKSSPCGKELKFRLHFVSI